MKKGVALFLIVSLVALDVPPVVADDSDIFGSNIQPNVLILIDSSGSMGDSVVSNPYVASTTYDVVNKCGSSNNQPCTSTVVYRKTSGDYVLYKNTVAEVANANAQNALNTTGFWSGSIGGSTVNLFLGNYLNYQLGFCPLNPCSEPKITIAKRVISNLIANTEGVRFGTMKFKSGGGQIMSPIGTAKSTIISGVNAMTLTSVGTVTGEQLRDAGLYYEGRFGFPSPIQLECQPNFAIVVSDGLYTGTDPRPHGTNRFTQDHAGGPSPEPVLPGTQNVIVHTVGFGLPQGDKDAGGLVALQDTARNGGGNFYLADNSAQLEQSLQDAISQIIAASFTFASPVIPTTSTTGSTRAYLASFQTDPVRPFWRGFLKAFDRDPTSGLVRVLPDGTPDPAYLAWEAGDLLRQKSPGSRVIYTVASGSRQNFTKSNANITAALLGVATAADRDKVIDFTQGIDAYDEDLDTNLTEERAWKLGDIFHSTPVLVTPPFSPSADPTYQQFKDDNASRTTVLLAGANDGMLHAFQESNGEELWAFIPPDLLGRLKDLTPRSGEHLYFVDGSPIVADIKVGSTWKTVAIFGERRGGKRYHVLDITNTTNPTLLWSFTDAKMGETWSEPTIGKVKFAGSPETEKYVAFVGGGYDTPQNNATGKAFFALDLATGEKLWEYFNDGLSSDDRQYMNFSLAANPTAADLTNDGFVDKVYIGDVGGQVWKFDVSAPATVSGGLVTNWTGKRLFAAAPSQANPPASGEYYPAQGIYGSPALAFDDQANLWVFFGTGDRNHPNNAASNRFYGIKDNTSMTNGSTLTESSLVDVTSANLTATQGWFFQLPGTGEKVLAAAEVFNKVAFFTTFTPTSVVSCTSGGGTASLYAINMLTGYAAIDWTTGTELASSDSSNTRQKTIGSGIPSKPVVVISYSDGSATASVVAATTSQQLPNNPAPSPTSLKRILYWREVLP